MKEVIAVYKRALDFYFDEFIGYVGNVAKLKRLNYNKIFVENLSIYTDILLI